MKDELDRQIIEALRRDGRRSNVEVARELGLSEGAVRKRLDKLLESGELHIVACPEPEHMGYPIRLLILLKVQLAHVERVGCALREWPEVVSVSGITGEYDLAVEAVFRSNEHWHQFLLKRLATLEGVDSSTSYLVSRAYKKAFEWAPPPPPPPRILVVDDDPDFQAITSTVLEQQGYTVAVASSGSGALAAMNQTPPDLIILDVMMEGILDGWDASRRIRLDPRLRRTPILVVSSITASEYAGMFPTDEDNLIDNFLSKPVDPQTLTAEVRRLLRRRS